MNIYNTFEPYDESNDIDDKFDKLNNNECFICMENYNNKVIIELIKIDTYIKQCNCNAYVHYDCFEKWVSIKSSCPICRIKMTKIINNPYFRNNGNGNGNINRINFISIQMNYNRLFFIYIIRIQIFFIGIALLIYFIYQDVNFNADNLNLGYNKLNNSNDINVSNLISYNN